ncbi:MAG TPA: hypothetical protein VGG85_12450 [Terracidiphilus sp.]|jgi:hypothetical protein
MSTGWFSAPAPVTQRVRAFFAPVNRKLQAPVIFDPCKQGGFILDTPPAPWIDLGWIQNFSRSATSKIASVNSGVPAIVLEQVRESTEGNVNFEFLSWTKLTMALATGSQHMNLLSTAQTASASADGGQATTAISMLGGSTASSILLTPSDAAQFSAGSIIAVDTDYTGQTGFVGTPISGAYLRQPLTDIDYIRRVTFNVAIVSQVTQNGISLAEPLPGGTPTSNAKVQQVAGFVDRLGGYFCHEWSALFVMEGSQGERIFFHYPRLQSMADAEEAPIPLSGKGSSKRVVLKSQFRALPVVDPLDAERVLCYRSFLPATYALV